MKQIVFLSSALLILGCGESPDIANGGAKSCQNPLGALVSEVSGTLGRTAYHFQGDARYTASDDLRNLRVENLYHGEQTWSIDFMPPAVGTYRCADATAPLVSFSNGTTLLDSATGDCTVTVTEVSDSRLVGQFSAVLSDATGTVKHTVSDGCFTLVFADAILDADLDGLSDADDGCPFDASNSCSIQPANINACSVDEV